MRMTLIGLAALAASIGVGACSKPATPTEGPPERAPDRAPIVVGNQPDRPVSQEPTVSTVIEVKDAAGIQSNDGQVIALVGRYAVISTGRHKVMYEQDDGSTGATNQLVRLVLDDKTNVDLWVRPDEEMEALTDKTVVATGRLIARSTRRPGGPGAQPDPGPSLVDIKSIVEQ